MAMVQLPADRFVVLGCDRCGGLFIDNEGCWALLRGDVDDRSKELVRGWTMKERPAPGPPGELGAYRKAARKDDEEEPLRCPGCRHALLGVDTDRDKHGVAIHLDVCRDDGTWFDAGEAWGLLQGVQLSSMAASLAVEMDRRDAAWSRNDQGELFMIFLETMLRP
jgi:hypothetical protein